MGRTSGRWNGQKSEDTCVCDCTEKGPLPEECLAETSLLSLFLVILCIFKHTSDRAIFLIFNSTYATDHRKLGRDDPFLII